MSRPPVSQKMEEALRASSAYRNMDPEDARRLRADLMRVMDVITDDRPVAAAMDSSGPSHLGSQIDTSTTDAGAAGMSDLKNAIGFGDFVKELITNVYDAIVKSSISQMEAYQKLLEDVIKPVSDFANERITDAQANNFAMGMMPNAFSMGSDGKLQAAPGQTPDLSKLGMPGVSMTGNTNAQEITNAAKLQMARQRQQLLATMVMMGINRIVVTDGEINAAMSININTEDRMSQGYANMTSTQASMGAQAQGSANATANTSASASGNLLYARTHSQLDQNASDAYLQAQASLSGRVNLKFKSETMPLDRFADGLSKTLLGDKATPQKTGTSTSGQSAPAAEGQSYGGRDGRGWFRGSRGTAGAPWPVSVTWRGRGVAQPQSWGR